MRIALLSDTHGNYPLALVALDQLKPVDLVLHLGDGCEDMQIISTAIEVPVQVVAGNCDRSPGVPREVLLTVAGKSILLTHGDQYRVKSGLGHLIAHARTLHADLVAYGHTHVAQQTDVDGMVLVNPGALAKVEPSPSVALVTMTDDHLTVEIIAVQQPHPQL
jgi:putative phosphoesterase